MKRATAVALAPLLLIATGALLLVLSASWIKLFPPTSYWTDADAAKLEELNEHIYKMYYQLSQEELAEIESRSQDTAAPQTPYEKAVKVRNNHRAKREIAMTRPKKIAANLRWGGLGCLIAGAVAFYASKHSA